MGFAEDLNHQQEQEQADYKAYALGEYTHERCPNCRRLRLCKCPNGKHRCEKCDWIPEEGRRYPQSL